MVGAVTSTPAAAEAVRGMAEGLLAEAEVVSMQVVRGWGRSGWDKTVGLAGKDFVTIKRPTVLLRKFSLQN
jgi:hypothetical protein